MEQKKKPSLAPGSDDLNENATQEEIQRGDVTKVTRLALDEVDPSGKPMD